MKFTLARPQQPRNPLVAAAKFRRAGSHRPTTASQRQQAKQALALELRRDRPRSGRAEHAPPERHSP